MQKGHRRILQKLLILSILFLQFSLAFHSHKTDKGLHCDACVVSLSETHTHHDGKICPIDIFFHINLSTFIAVILFTSLPCVAVVILPVFREQIPFSHIALPFSSRAPPYPLILS